MEIVYLPMPISAEEKREWNKKGFKVVDEFYKPEAEEVEPEAEKPEAEEVEPEAEKPEGKK